MHKGNNISVEQFCVLYYSLNYHWSIVLTNCKFEADMSQLSPIGGTVLLDNIICRRVKSTLSREETPSEYNSLVSWNIDITGQNCSVLCERSALSSAMAADVENLGWVTQWMTMNPTGAISN